MEAAVGRRKARGHPDGDAELFLLAMLQAPLEGHCAPEESSEEEDITMGQLRSALVRWLPRPFNSQDSASTERRFWRCSKPSWRRGATVQTSGSWKCCSMINGVERPLKMLALDCGRPGENRWRARRGPDKPHCAQHGPVSGRSPRCIRSKPRRLRHGGRQAPAARPPNGLAQHGAKAGNFRGRRTISRPGTSPWKTKRCRKPC